MRPQSVVTWMVMLLMVLATGCTPAQPKWIDTVPPTDNGVMHFVGVSRNAADVQISRDDAFKNAAGQVVKYFGVQMTDKLNEGMATYGVSSQTIDPTVASVELKHSFSNGVARRLKVAQYYEQPQKNDNVYRTYVLTNIPVTAINEAYKQALQAEANKIKAKKAGPQTDNALKMLQDLQSHGLDTSPGQ